MKKFREKTQTVIIASSSAAGTRLFTLVTDSDAETIVGLKISRITEGGLTYYNVGFKPNNGGAYVKDVTNVDDFVASTSVAKSERWNDVQAPAAGNTYQIEVETFSATSSELRFQFQTRCELI